MNINEVHEMKKKQRHLGKIISRYVEENGTAAPKGHPIYDMLEYYNKLSDEIYLNSYWHIRNHILYY